MFRNAEVGNNDPSFVQLAILSVLLSPTAKNSAILFKIAFLGPPQSRHTAGLAIHSRLRTGHSHMKEYGCVGKVVGSATGRRTRNEQATGRQWSQVIVLVVFGVF